MNASGGVPGYAMNQEWHVWKIMEVALPQIQCQLHDHAKRNIQAKFYNEKLPLVYESDNIGDSLSWRS